MHNLGRWSQTGGLRKTDEAKAFRRKLLRRPITLRGDTEYIQPNLLGKVVLRYLVDVDDPVVKALTTAAWTARWCLSPHPWRHGYAPDCLSWGRVWLSGKGMFSSFLYGCCGTVACLTQGQIPLVSECPSSCRRGSRDTKMGLDLAQQCSGFVRNLHHRHRSALPGIKTLCKMA